MIIVIETIGRGWTTEVTEAKDAMGYVNVEKEVWLNDNELIEYLTRVIKNDWHDQKIDRKLRQKDGDKRSS